MKKILIPTDFSPYADAALDHGISIAKKTGAQLILLHVLLTPVNWAKLTKEQENLYPETQAAIRKSKVQLSERLKKIEANGIAGNDYLQMVDGKEQLDKYVDLEKIDLVIMGSHGQYGFKDHVLGSNTYGVLRKSRVPVLVVKADSAGSELKTLVFASDLKESSGKAFHKIEMISELLGAKLHILYVNTPANFKEDLEIKQLAQNFLEKYAHYNFPVHHYSAYKEERGIIQFSETIGADAVAVITHGKTDFQQIFSPSITENLITYLKLPILSVNLRSV